MKFTTVALLLSIFRPTHVDAAVRPIYLHVDPPSGGVEIRDVLDISQVVNIGEPQILPAGGLMLTTEQMAGTMEDINSVVKDYGPVNLFVDPEEPRFIAVPLDKSTVLTIDPGKAGKRYSATDRLKLAELAERAEHLGVLIMLEWLRLVRR